VPIATPTAELRPQSAGDPTCNACPHPTGEHDAIAARYCRATRASAADRGCVCRPAS
jgi:hypothetical protein